MSATMVGWWRKISWLERSKTVPETNGLKPHIWILDFLVESLKAHKNCQKRSYAFESPKEVLKHSICYFQTVKLYDLIFKQ